MTLDARPVDPRDVTVEESEPIYRVAFWTPDGGRCRDYEVTGVDDVAEVIGWADANAAASETYILSVLSQETIAPPGRRSPEVTLIRLKGDPPSGQGMGSRRGQ